MTGSEFFAELIKRKKSKENLTSAELGIAIQVTPGNARRIVKGERGLSLECVFESMNSLWDDIDSFNEDVKILYNELVLGR